MLFTAGVSLSPLSAGETDIFVIMLEAGDGSEICYYQVRLERFVEEARQTSIPHPGNTATGWLRRGASHEQSCGAEPAKVVVAHTLRMGTVMALESKSISKLEK